MSFRIAGSAFLVEMTVYGLVECFHCLAFEVCGLPLPPHCLLRIFRVGGGMLGSIQRLSKCLDYPAFKAHGSQVSEYAG